MQPLKNSQNGLMEHEDCRLTFLFAAKIGSNIAFADDTMEGEDEEATVETDDGAAGGDEDVGEETDTGVTDQVSSYRIQSLELDGYLVMNSNIW